MQLHLIRHPPPEVAAGVCYGATDLAVTKCAIDATLAALATRLPKQVPLYSSVLQRCHLLAEPLAALRQCGPVRPDPRLVEMNFGRWEMQPWDAIARSEIEAWASDVVDYRPGAGESVREVAARVMAFRDELLQHQCRQAIVVCHAGTIRLLLAWQAGACLRETALRAASASHQIAYGGMVTLDC